MIYFLTTHFSVTYSILGPGIIRGIRWRPAYYLNLEERVRAHKRHTVDRSEWAQIHYINCIYLYQVGNRDVNPAQWGFIFSFTTCLFCQLTMWLSPVSLSSVLCNTCGFFEAFQKSYSSVVVLLWFFFRQMHPHLSTETVNKYKNVCKYINNVY